MNLEKIIGQLIVLTIAAAVLASVLPLIFPYLACVFVFVLIARLVWWYTR
jgi:hypothetical protein